MAINLFFELLVPGEAKASTAMFSKAAALGLGRKNANNTVNIVFTDGPGIKSLNRRFLKKNSLTDVIAFNSPFSPAPCAVWGEIYICLPQARRQAAAMGHSLTTELLILIVHGALHLAGMDDCTPARRKEMNKRTLALLRKICK